MTAKQTQLAFRWHLHRHWHLSLQAGGTRFQAGPASVGQVAPGKTGWHKQSRAAPTLRGGTGTAGEDSADAGQVGGDAGGTQAQAATRYRCAALLLTAGKAVAISGRDGARPCRCLNRATNDTTAARF